MQQNDWSIWLNNRGFYALMILVLLVVGLGLAWLRRKRNKPPSTGMRPAGARRRKRH